MSILFPTFPKTPRPPPPQQRRPTQFQKMLEIIERTPALQADWERFSVLLKLSCEPDEIDIIFPKKDI